jgi:hypothetical protein
VARNKVAGIGEGRRALSALAAACLCLLAGCGLETTIYYNQPTFVNSGGAFKLTHNTANTDSSFRGYNLYYRVYQSSTDATAIVSYISSTLQDTNNYTPASAVSLLTGSRGFVRILAGNSNTNTKSDSVPLYPIPNTALATYFSLIPDRTTSTTDWYYTVDGATTPQTTVVRNNGLTFNSQYATSDIDYVGATSALTGDTVYIVIFAVAYGFDFSSSSSPVIYSLPVCADYLPYTIPN